MIDACGRLIDHLRLSLTDHCNLACRYCAPPPGHRTHRIIDPELAVQLVRWLVTRHGIHNVRLTGGEPLLHPDLIPIVERLVRLGSLQELTLTTNGQTLAAQAEPLRKAGLHRVNVSLDTLVPERYAWLTRGGDLLRTLTGIDAAVRAGLTPVRINIVVQRGLNDDELVDLAEWGLKHGCVVRFLEVMPIGPIAHLTDKHLVPAAEVLARLEEAFELRLIPRPPGQPSVDYAATNGRVRGVIGVIAPTTRPFCDRCRRLRVTARGEIVPCVHDRYRVDLRAAWDGHTLDEELASRLLRAAVRAKKPVGPMSQSVPLVTIGG